MSKGMINDPYRGHLDNMVRAVEAGPKVLDRPCGPYTAYLIEWAARASDYYDRQQGRTRLTYSYRVNSEEFSSIFKELRESGWPLRNTVTHIEVMTKYGLLLIENFELLTELLPSCPDSPRTESILRFQMENMNEFDLKLLLNDKEVEDLRNETHPQAKLHIMRRPKAVPVPVSFTYEEIELSEQTQISIEEYYVLDTVFGDVEIVRTASEEGQQMVEKMLTRP